MSPSIPLGLYRGIDITTGSVQRGDLVLACLPRTAAELARRRHYVPRGWCPGDILPVGKVVAAVAGDTLTTSARGLMVNGRAVPHSVPWARDSRGRPLPHPVFGTFVLGVGTVWLVSPVNDRSYDSRYVGAVPLTHLRTRLEPVWTSRTTSLP